MSTTKRSPTGDESDNKRTKVDTPSKVLLVRNLLPTTTEGQLSDLCSPFGTVVQTLVVGPKRHGFVEMSSEEESQIMVAEFAQQPKSLNGSAITIEYSRRSNIRPNARYTGGAAGVPVEGGQLVLLISVTNSGGHHVGLEQIHAVCSRFGTVQRIVLFQKQTLVALVEFAHAREATAAKDFMHGKELYEGFCQLQITFSTRPAPLRIVANNERARDYTQFGHGGGMGGMGEYGASRDGVWGATPMGGVDRAAGGPGCVLLINGLPTHLSTDDVFTLFGVYGDVMRVKIVYNKRDSALVQFSNALQAATARQHLDKLAVYGSELSVVMSKHPSINIPKNSASTETTTKDYSESKAHRFKFAGSRNEKHVAAPSASLHASNLPADVSEEELLAFFTAPATDCEHALEVHGMKVFGKEVKNMAFVTFESVDAATQALLRFHGVPFGGHSKHHVRLTYSHSKKQQER